MTDKTLYKVSSLARVVNRLSERMLTETDENIIYTLADDIERKTILIRRILDMEVKD